MPTHKIAFAGTDGRTLLSAVVASGKNQNDYQGMVVRGNPAMQKWAEWMDWPVQFVDTDDNSADSYAKALARSQPDWVMPMPEGLLFNGVVDRIRDNGFSSQVIGLDASAAFIEGDKIECKRALGERIPFAPEWVVVDAKDWQCVKAVVLRYLRDFGGAVLKYPYSAGGKGARVIQDGWELASVYKDLLADYKKDYKQFHGNREWPLLIESRMAGFEISFTALIDGNGNYAMLPTALDYPGRFEGPPGGSNPVTGGMGSVSPHPLETPALMDMAAKQIIEPFIEVAREKGFLRPCVIYPGCFVSFVSDPVTGRMEPDLIRVCEINIRPGEPEWQPIVRRVANLGELIRATGNNQLHQVQPKVRDGQVSICIALVTGPGGLDGQKGYPWSVTKHEPMEIDAAYLKKKNIQLIPSAMGWSEEKGFYSDGTRVGFLNANGQVKDGQTKAEVADKLQNKILNTFDNHKVRVVPREDRNGNRLDLRRDIGQDFNLAEQLQ